MNEFTDETLTGIALRALERSAFVFADVSPPEDHPVLPARTRFVRICVTGSIAGELVLGASDGFVRELAASLLGVEPGEVDPAAHGTDALKEMANMIAGSVVLEYDGANRSYTLGLPQPADKSVLDAAAKAGMTTTVVTSGEPLTLVWISAERSGVMSEAA